MTTSKKEITMKDLFGEEKMKIMYKNCVTKEQRKKVRDYCKDFHCDDLTIVLTDDWTFYAYIRGNKTNKKYSQGGNVNGRFSFANTAIHQYGFKRIPCPYIVINMNKSTWWRTFLHEFAHYLDFKERPEMFFGRTRGMTRSLEKFAKDYAELAEKVKKDDNKNR